MMRTKARVRTDCLALVGLAVFAIACASGEPLSVKSVAVRQLKCSPDDVYAVVNRTTPKVREWIVGCDFYYARVHCTSGGCEPARPKPPCIGELTCFEEDPVTLEWRLPRTAHRD